MNKSYYYLKRILDLAAALVLLVLSLPVFLFIAAAIKLDSPGRVLFKQQRLGKDGRIFTIYKFRTMVQNAEDTGSGIYTNERDSRITRTGHILRKTSLDELPQLLNIIKGEMSFVGPRPPVPYHPREYKDYSVEQKKRFKVLPGITGYAQVMGRNNLTWDERIVLDIQYVENLGIVMDIRIILLTLSSVVLARNIYRGSVNDGAPKYKS